jgi:hypothetical protein
MLTKKKAKENFVKNNRRFVVTKFVKTCDELFIDFNPPSENEVVTEKYLPIYPYGDKSKSEFDWEKYQSQLSTKSLGQIGRDHRFTSLAC